MSRFAIAGLQLALEHGNNQDMILREIRLVKRRFPWVNMVVLSELATYGANPDNAIRAGHDTEQRYCEAAATLGIWLIPGSLYERRGEQIFNMSPVICPDGEVVARYCKMYPFLPYESGVAAGTEPVVFDVSGVGRFGVSICYDKWFPETTRALVWQGAEVIIHPTLTNTIDRDVELAMTRSSAATNQCYFFDVNTAAPMAFGQSMVAGPGGEIIHQAGRAAEVFPVEVDLDYVRRVRKQGWHGLGQPLKSFRDSGHEYPQYSGTTSTALDELGPLEIPGALG